MVIDAHVHLYPPEVNRDPVAWAQAHGEQHWALLCTRRRKSGQAVQAFPSVDELLRDMDTAGVARAVMLGWYWEKPATCALQNRFYAECVRAHPDRLSAFATVHPASGRGALEEMRRAAGDGLVGIGELSPHSQGGIDDPVWLEILALAGELKLPVNFHVTDPRSKPYPGRVDTPLADFVRLAKAFPATTFMLAHWGGGLAWSDEAATLPNVWFDTAASPLLYGPDAWKRARNDRVLFGSDYPLILYPQSETTPGFERLLSEARQAGGTNDLFAANAEKLLRLRTS